jgi:hypothetical protein
VLGPRLVGPHPVAVAVDVEDDRAMEQPVEPPTLKDIVHAALNRCAREAGRPGYRRHLTPPDGERLRPAVSRQARSSSSGETARYQAAMAASSITHRCHNIGNALDTS